eukprot:263250_1
MANRNRLNRNNNRNKVQNRNRNRMNYLRNKLPGLHVGGRGSKTKWSHSHITGSGGNGISKSLTSDTVEIWKTDKKEFEFITNKNLLDIQLYKFSYWIADADAYFYQLV